MAKNDTSIQKTDESFQGQRGLDRFQSQRGLDRFQSQRGSRIDTLKKIEIPEGVEISIRVAGPVTRASAFAIDILIMVATFFVINIFVGLLATIFGGSLAQGFLLILIFLLYWFYFIFFESGKKGATPGKRAMKLRVVMSDGTPAPLSAICIRNMLKPVDMMPMMTCGIGLFTCLMTSKFQRLGDMAADTVVTHVTQTKQAKQIKQTRQEQVVVRSQRAPLMPLTHEEQSAIVAFKERHQQWGPLRSEELAAIIEPVIFGRKENSQQLNMTDGYDLSGAPKKFQYLLEIGEWIQRGEQIDRKSQENSGDSRAGDKSNPQSNSIFMDQADASMDMNTQQVFPGKTT